MGVLSWIKVEGGGMREAANSKWISMWLVGLWGAIAAFCLYVMFCLYFRSWEIQIAAALPLLVMSGALATQALWRRDVLERALRHSEAKCLEAERLRAEDQSRAVDLATHAKSEFLAVMSHEIRTPMSGVLGFIDLLLDGPFDPKQRKNAEALREAAGNLQLILNNILDFSKLEAGRLEVIAEPFDLSKTIISICAAVEPLALEKGLEFQVSLCESLPSWVDGDSFWLGRVLSNLLGNAVKFTECGHVGLSVAMTGHTDESCRLRFEIDDSGPGIPSGDLEHFSQPDTIIGKQSGGDGLGLAICKRVVHLLGGRIGCDSVVGQGSTFWFELAMPRAAAVPIARIEPVPALKPLSLLVVEDDPINRRFLVEALTRDGHDVTSVDNGAEAVFQAKTGRFSAILMDINLPELDGFSATRAIRALPGSAGWVPIIAVTAKAFRSDQERCLAAGMDACLGKPVNWKKMRETLAKLSSGPCAPAPSPSPASFCPVSKAKNQRGKRLVDDKGYEALIAKVGEDVAAQLRIHFVTDAREIVTELRAAAAAGVITPETVRRAHNLRSTSALFGFQSLGSLAADIEVSLALGDLQSALPLINRLPDRLSRSLRRMKATLTK